MAPPPRRNPPQSPSHGNKRKGEEPWLAAGLRPGNFLPGLAIGFLLGLLLDLSASWRPKSSLAPAPPPAAAALRGSKRTGGSSASGGVTGSEELKMVLVVRQDLKMGTGKIASQCAHAATGLYAKLSASNRGLLRQWEQFGQAKIVLTCKNQQEMNRLKDTAEQRGIPTFVVADAGRTQVLAGSKTVLAIGPEHAGFLKLLCYRYSKCVNFKLVFRHEAFSRILFLTVQAATNGTASSNKRRMRGCTTIPFDNLGTI